MPTYVDPSSYEIGTMTLYIPIQPEHHSECSDNIATCHKFPSPSAFFFESTYQYGYQSGQLEEDGGYNFKHEYKDENGVLYGQHGYALPDGFEKTVNYVADARGYRVLADGQEYQPVSEQELERRRGLLEDIQADEEEQEPLNLDLGLLEKISDPSEVKLESDPAVALSAQPQTPYSQLDPDTNAFRFGFRSASGDGVLFRKEERDDAGVVSGQYGYRGADGAPVLVSYVSDAFGYRLVDPAAPVAVVSREQAEEQLGELVEGSGEAPNMAEAEPTPEGSAELPQPQPVAAPETEEEEEDEEMEPQAEPEPEPEPEPQPDAGGAAVAADAAAYAAADAVVVTSADGASSDAVATPYAGGATVDSIRPYFQPVHPVYSAVIPFGGAPHFAPLPSAHYAAQPLPYGAFRPLPYPVYRAAAPADAAALRPGYGADPIEGAAAATRAAERPGRVRHKRTAH